MRSRLLPAAEGLYRQENARLASSYAQATRFPVIAVITAAIGTARARLWATRLDRKNSQGTVHPLFRPHDDIDDHDPRS